MYRNKTYLFVSITLKMVSELTVKTNKNLSHCRYKKHIFLKYTLIIKFRLKFKVKRNVKINNSTKLQIIESYS